MFYISLHIWVLIYLLSYLVDYMTSYWYVHLVSKLPIIAFDNLMCYTCYLYVLYILCVCAVVGFSIPSFFGYLTTRNPAKGLLRVATLGQADFLVQLASGGRWVSVPALWEGVLATSATAGVDSSGSVLWSWAGWLLQRGAASHQQAMQFLERASATQNLITVPDLLVITAGYLVFILDSCFLSLLASLLASRLSRGDFRRLGRNVSLLLDFVKVIYYTTHVLNDIDFFLSGRRHIFFFF